jgi:putative ABC transport system permease protein
MLFYQNRGHIVRPIPADEYLQAAPAFASNRDLGMLIAQLDLTKQRLSSGELSAVMTAGGERFAVWNLVRRGTFAGSLVGDAIIVKSESRFAPGRSMKFIPLIIRNLLRNRRRTILSVLSIAVSTCIFAGLMSVPAVAARILRERVSALRLICGNKAGYNYLLPAAYAETIRDLPHVSAMTGYLVMMTTYRKAGELIPVVGIDPDQLHVIWPEWASAQDASALGHSLSAGLAGPALMRRFNWKLDDNVILHGLSPPGDLSFTVAGTLASQFTDNLVIVPIDRLNNLVDFEGKVAIFFVKADASEFAQPLLKEIDARFANAPFETSTQTELGVAQSQLHDFRLLFVGAELFAGIVVIVIALVSANTAAMSVRERRHELAVMRAIGFNRRSLVGFIVSEGLLMGLVAGAIGTAIAYIGLRLGGPALLGPQFGLHLMPTVAAESVAVAGVIGLLSAAIPALSGTRRAIADSLRSTV